MAIKRMADITYSSAVKMMIYGQSGMGKSTLALSAPNPVYFDFDGSGKRLTYVDENLATMYPENWQEVRDQLNTAEGKAELAPFATIVVDTASKMMDMIIKYVCGDRQPQLQHWGKINGEFTWFLNALVALDKNVIVVAQRKSKGNADKEKFAPQFRDTNNDALVSELDLLGYLEMTEDEKGHQYRTITFNPTARNEGKNTCNLPATMNIPTLKTMEQNTFIADKVIKPYQEMLKQKAEANKAYHTALADIRKRIADVADADGANKFVEYMKGVKPMGNIKALALAEFTAKAKALGLAYNKEAKAYEQVA